MPSSWEDFKTTLPALSLECRRLGSVYEFDSFVVGCSFGDCVEPRDASGPSHDEVRRYFNRGVGLYLDRLWPAREVEFNRPEFRFNLHPATVSVEIEVRSLFIGGRYRKLSRGIPQSRWPCRSCRGSGCERCNFTGRRYEESVEELLAGPILATTYGDTTKIHCMGREDIDARMLGSGRPFVLEVLNPRRRSLDLAAAAKAIRAASKGRVDVSGLRIVDRAAVARLKEARAEKTYRAHVAGEGGLPLDFRERIESLRGALIAQWTPTRVRHRRGDILRERRVVEISAVVADCGRFEIIVRGEAGLYIKELVSGDSGRTRPSLSSVLDLDCRCEALDVLDVHAELPCRGDAPKEGLTGGTHVSDVLESG